MKLTTRKKQQMRARKTCQCCGLDNDLAQALYGRPLEIHHIQPRREGGSDDPSNLTTLCSPCHRAYHQWAEEQGLSWDNYINGAWKDCIREMYWKTLNGKGSLTSRLHRTAKYERAISLMNAQGG